MAPVITPTNTSDVISGRSSLQPFTYDQLMFWAQTKSNNTFDEYASYVAEHFGVGEEEAMLQFLRGSGTERGFGINAQKMADGSYSGYIFNNPVDLPESNPLNSNAGTTARATFREMVGQKFNDVEGTLVRNMTRYPSAGGLGQKASYVLGSIGSAVGAVSTGLWLGKTIDSALYNANPDFWNNIGLSSLDPATWGSLTNGSDSPFAGLLNFILGIDPDTGTAQMYMNQDALAYMAYCMNQAGVFSSGSGAVVPPTDISTYFPNRAIQSIYASDSAIRVKPNREVYSIIKHNTHPVYFGYIKAADGVYGLAAASLGPFGYTNSINEGQTFNSVSKTISGFTYYHSGFSLNYYGDDGLYSPQQSVIINTSNNQYVYDGALWGYAVLKGSIEPDVIDGIGDQTGATLPDTSTWTTPADTLASLQQQYPDAFNDAMTWDNYADDGTPAQTTWIPVPFPNTTFANDTQPTSGTQAQTSINISDLPETLIKVITDIVQQPQTETEPKPATPPQNPVDTGTGEPPILVPPSGSASALWSVYHPTPQQINDFGAWLWTDNVIEQFLRLMNNPMEGIISLHKVYAMPVDASTATIVVGRLDSNVPSATVTQQYVYVDCGTVQLNEQFVNVFDYQPFTSVSLYLPFIGIVPLDVGDVMRASIHIKYGVDVFTGACLAMVEVIRDGNTVNMYQYTGVASVSYPLTGAQNSGLLSGLLGVAAGIGTIATTGNPMGLGMAVSGAVSASHVNMGRSGGFSGNAGAMGIKIPYLIITRPQTMVAQTFPNQLGYPTNYSATLGSYTGFVQCRALHVEGVPATQTELNEIRSLLESGVMV